MAAWCIVRESFLEACRPLISELSSKNFADCSPNDQELLIWYNQTVFVLDFAIPLVRDMDFCLSSKHPDYAARYQQCKEYAVLLQLIICHPTRSKYAVPALLERRYRQVVRSLQGPIAELDRILNDNPYLLSSERLEILIGTAAAGNGMNHSTTTDDGGRKWLTTLISSMLSASIKGQECGATKFHRQLSRQSPGVDAAVGFFSQLASVRLMQHALFLI